MLLSPVFLALVTTAVALAQKCLSDKDALSMVSDYTTLITKTQADFNTTLAKQLLASDYHSTSSGVDYVREYPVRLSHIEPGPMTVLLFPPYLAGLITTSSTRQPSRRDKPSSTSSSPSRLSPPSQPKTSTTRATSLFGATRSIRCRCLLAGSRSSSSTLAVRRSRFRPATTRSIRGRCCIISDCRSVRRIGR